MLSDFDRVITSLSKRDFPTSLGWWAFEGIYRWSETLRAVYHVTGYKTDHEVVKDDYCAAIALDGRPGWYPSRYASGNRQWEGAWTRIYMPWEIANDRVSGMGHDHQPGHHFDPGAGAGDYRPPSAPPQPPQMIFDTISRGELFRVEAADYPALREELQRFAAHSVSRGQFIYANLALAEVRRLDNLLDYQMTGNADGH